jgi:hypothetical protein
MTPRVRKTQRFRRILTYKKAAIWWKRLAISNSGRDCRSFQSIGSK